MDTAREEMIVRNMPLVSFVVGRMSDENGSSALDREDAVAYGIEGLIQAVDSYDPTRGTTFASFAIRRIRGSIERAVTSDTNAFSRFQWCRTAGRRAGPIQTWRGFGFPRRLRQGRDGPKLARAQEAARLFASRLGPEDRLEIIAFNQQAQRVLAFGDDPSRAAAALSSIGSFGGTSLYEALLVAANDLVHARAGMEPETREVIIVLSDGEDTASVVGFDEALPVLRRSGALVYALSLRADAKGVWLGATWPLLELARDTGGRTLSVPILDKLPALYEEIAAEVRHLYRIGYVSNDERRDGQWRQVAVRVLTRDARVRTRAGYYAAGQPKAR